MTPFSTDPPRFEPGPSEVRGAGNAPAGAGGGSSAGAGGAASTGTGASAGAVVPVDRRRANVRLAWTIAIAVDFLQWIAFPLFVGGAVSPWNDALDVLVAVVMIRLLGWHWSFVPTFLVELFPLFDLTPTWTLAVLLATRRQKTLPPGGR